MGQFPGSVKVRSKLNLCWITKSRHVLGMVLVDLLNKTVTVYANGFN